MVLWPTAAEVKRFLRRRGIAAGAAVPLEVTRSGASQFKANLRVRLGQGSRAAYVRFNIPSRDTAYESLAAYRALRALTAARVAGVPKPVGYWPQWRAVAYHELPGVTLTQVLNAPRAWAPATDRVCRWLTALQRKQVPGPRRLPAQYVLHELGWWRHNFRRATDAIAVGALGYRLIAQRRTLGGGIRRSLVHGDFNPGNVLLHRGCVAVLDFGHAYHGDPLADWGDFLAQLYAFKVQRRVRGSPLAGEQAMLARLPRQARARERLYAYAAWHSLKAAAYLAATQPRRAYTRELLALAHRFSREV